MTTLPALAVETCARRLAPFMGSDGVASQQVAPEISVSWHGPAGFAPGRPWSEASVQALGGLMEIHGRDAGTPRRIGLDVASIAAGLLAAQGALAVEVGRSRGRPVSGVETSVVQACLLLVSHYVAVATCFDDDSGTTSGAHAGPAPGPPFPTSDGYWFEMETFDPEAWKTFWLELGSPGAELGRAWTAFRLRYNTGTCSLPRGLHEATGERTMAQLADVAEACDVSLSPLRSYHDVLVQPGLWDGRPIVTANAAHTASAQAAPGSRAVPASKVADRLPLSGLKVVEATNRVQGPLAGLLLQMLGAQVTLVEPPGGDVSRMGTPAAGDTGAFFSCFNRGKQSTQLNLRSAEGRAELVELVTAADVFLHNWRPGRAEQWNMTYQELSTQHPGLVYAGASGFGRVPGPHPLGTDFMVQAYAGMGNGINPEGTDPFPSRALLVDYVGGLVACEGVLSGLLHRERTGQGCVVETSLLAAAMTLQFPALEALASGREEGRRDGRPVWRLLDQPVEAADGLLVLSVDDSESLARLCHALEVGPGDSAPKALEPLLLERIRLQPRRRVEELLLAAEIPSAAACTDLTALATDPRLARLFEPLGGTSRVPASPWRFSA